MQVFVRVVEQGAFGRAADDLGLSRAAVTGAIGKLEKRLGVRLLNRTTRRLSLTDEGRSYYADCVRLLDQVAEAEDKLSGTRLAPRGRLRVSVPQSFGDRILYPALVRFMERYPDLGLELVVTDRTVNLVEEGIDCALRGAEIAADAELVARKLSSAYWVTCASPEYLAANGTPETIDDLAHHECIRFISPSTGRGRDWMFAENGEPRTWTPYGRMQLTSLDGAVDAAATGFGIAQVSDAVAFQALLDGQLQAVLTDYIIPAPSLMFVYPGNRYLTAKVRAFNEFLADVFPRDGWWPQIERSGIRQSAPALSAVTTHEGAVGGDARSA